GRVLGSSGLTQVVHNYQSIPGAIPLPATLSLEFGQVVAEQQTNVKYRFVSDFPFTNRAPHALDAFEKQGLATLRQDPTGPPITEITGSLFDRRIRLVAPVTMNEVCVDCHNTHPESPKRDWKVGDVRGIQEVIVDQPVAANILSFKFLLLYFAFTATVGISFLALQRRQAALILGINSDLEVANEFLASVSMKIAKYLSPQVYKGIFSGEKDVSISTERKKLTIFFSDIKDFSATAERLQPEELTVLLNEYLSEMSDIALKHGATLDKFIGDAILAFFGDPQSRGTIEDAKACLRMATDMQRRLAELNMRWRARGIEHPFRVRMGINTGFCNVGNFGSSDRMDYTIIGAEANLAARLQAIAEAGGIVMSYETYALVRDIVHARPLAPISVKGISREVIPYVVEELLDETGEVKRIFSEHMAGADFFMDPSVVDEQSAARLRSVLKSAIEALEMRRK
ncbi:MAG TPA: adenylate/guanylate cyclase domain-containing protein, partial [Micropepsaceae bacterium]|nr:adenylate/guanylate cyclase domain-containing protein [Micropepsaceae bacterium]